MNGKAVNLQGPSSDNEKKKVENEKGAPKLENLFDEEVKLGKEDKEKAVERMKQKKEE